MLCLFVTLFHSLGKFDFLFTRQKGHFTDVLEVDFDRVVNTAVDDFVKRDIVVLNRLFNLDVFRLQSIEHHFHIFGGCVEMFEFCHYLVFTHRAFALSQSDDFVNLLFQKLFSVHVVLLCESKFIFN